MDQYCEVFNVQLVVVGVTGEGGKPEVDYYFNDGRGYVTIEGILNSFLEAYS